MDSIRARVAARIKGIRIRRKMTQKQLAAKAHITRAYLARVETGRHEPTLSMLDRLARVLNVTVADLVK